MNTKKYATKVNPFAKAKVAIIGDLMLDTFIYGEVHRISPEAPVPVVHAKRRTYTLGGAGNVARNLRALEVDAQLVSLIGKDGAAEDVKRIARESQIDHKHLVASSRPTICKTRVVAQGQQVCRIDEEEVETLTTDERVAITARLKEVRKHADVVIVSDYGKGLIDQAMFEEIRVLWKDGTVLVDPKPRPDIAYIGATLMTPNLRESAELAGVKNIARNDVDAEKMATLIKDKYQLDAMLMTRSGDGMTLVTNKKTYHFPSFENLEVRDVSGAGDTVIAVIAAALAAGIPLPEAVNLSNISGNVVVAKQGTATISWPEIFPHIA